MKRFNLQTLIVVGCGIGLPLIAFAQFRGPATQPVTGNVPGVIWNASGTTAVQPGAQMDFTGTNWASNPTFKSDIGLTTGRAFRVDRSGGGLSTFFMGNWGSGGPAQPLQFTVNGDFLTPGVSPYNATGIEGRIQGRKFCFYPGNPADCITTWPSGGGSVTSSLYVQKAGDAMTGSLRVGSSTAPIAYVPGVINGAIEGYGGSNGAGVYGWGLDGTTNGVAGISTDGTGVYAWSQNGVGLSALVGTGPAAMWPVTILGTNAGIGLTASGKRAAGYFNGYSTGVYAMSATGTGLYARVGNGGPTVSGMTIAPSTAVVGRGLENGGHFVGYENGVQGWSSTGTGVYGSSNGGLGVYGYSQGGTAVYGDGYDGTYGVYARVTGDAGGIAAVYGSGDSNTIGVYGGGGTGISGYGTNYGGDFTGESTGIIARSTGGGQAIITDGDVQVNGGDSVQVDLEPAANDNGQWKARYFLDRYSTSRAGGLWINASNNNTSWFVGAPYFNGSPTDDFMIGFDPTNPHNRGNYRMILTSTGVPRFSGLISCGTLGTSGNGTVTCSSDARLKDIKGSFTPGLDAIVGIEPKIFSWKKDTDLYDGGVLNYGFIAQNLQKTLPEAVTTGAEGQLQVGLTPILAASVNAIKELKAENDDLRQKVEGLEERLEKLEQSR